MAFYQPAVAIIPGRLYLGGMKEAGDWMWLVNHRISTIVSCAEETVPDFPKEFNQENENYMDLCLPDSPSWSDEKLAAIKIEGAADFIHSRKGPVYVHCVAGVNRSPTVVMRYLMKYQGMGYEEALKHIQSCRNIGIAAIYRIILLTKHMDDIS